MPFQRKCAIYKDYDGAAAKKAAESGKVEEQAVADALWGKKWERLTRESAFTAEDVGRGLFMYFEGKCSFR